mmetsp:Transcript_126222/g.353498  ORF Transcript_126222/g.353498 Transcript_126222/m.353498 type:complete len:220 (-) Transcript_126222:2-661(-)
MATNVQSRGNAWSLWHPDRSRRPDDLLQVHVRQKTHRWCRLPIGRRRQHVAPTQSRRWQHRSIRLRALRILHEALLLLLEMQQRVPEMLQFRDSLNLRANLHAPELLCLRSLLQIPHLVDDAGVKPTTNLAVRWQDDMHKPCAQNLLDVVAIPPRGWRGHGRRLITIITEVVLGAVGHNGLATLNEILIMCVLSRSTARTHRPTQPALAMYAGAQPRTD